MARQSVAEDSGGPGAGGDRDGPPRRQGLQALLETAGLVAAPLSIVGSALVYFGAVELRQEASIFGVDPALLGYSNQELLIRAVAPMMMPVAVGCVIVAAAIQANVNLGRRAVTLELPKPIARRLRRLQGAGLLLVLAGMVWQWRIGPAFSYLTPPLMASGALLGFGARAYREMWEDGPSGQRRAASPAAALDVGSKVAFSLIVVFSIFGITARLAEANGTARAAEYMNTIRDRPTVSVLSKEPLSFHLQGVACLAVRGSPYTRRYVGFRLVTYRQGRYFLVPEGFNRNYAVTVVLSEGPDLRFEYDATRSLDGRTTDDEPLLASPDPALRC